MVDGGTVPLSQPGATPGTGRNPGPSPTWLAFMLMAFLIVGLMGLFATFAAPLPLQRAMIREATLDEAQAAAHGPDAAAALAALLPRLDDSADALMPPGARAVPADIDARIARERLAMRTRMERDSDALAVRLRWLICLVTVMAAAFGLAVMHAARRGAG